jgi:hypothetical protein
MPLVIQPVGFTLLTGSILGKNQYQEFAEFGDGAPKRAPDGGTRVEASFADRIPSMAWGNPPVKPQPRRLRSIAALKK